MKSGFGMVLCFGVAIAGAVSIAWDFFGMPDPSTLVIQWAPLFESLPVFLVATGILVIIFTLIRHPNNSETVSNFAGSNNDGLGKLVLPAANIDSENVLPVDDIDILEDEVDFPEDEVDFVDYPEDNPTRAGGGKARTDFRSAGHTEDIEIPELTEARVLLTFDRVNEAIETLKEALDNKSTNYDVIAMELVTVLENEIDDGEISDSRRSELMVVRDDFITQLAREKEKLSDDVWHYVHLEYPEITEAYMEHHVNDPQVNFEKARIAGI